MKAQKNEKFGLIKTLIDAHTMGVYAAAALLKDCGYTVISQRQEKKEPWNLWKVKKVKK